ncbi:MAG: hypothetical protein FVQ83_11290 [Chloroflexi bacterium]|nr:hypothetical protein [Chloroflexota bacterium]
MWNKKFISLMIVLLLISLACTLSGSENADQEDDNSSESSNVDTGDANSSGGEDDPGDSQPEPEDNVAETIDLGAVNQLSAVHPNYIYHAIGIIQGTGLDSSPVSFEFVLRIETQTDPFEAYHTVISDTMAGELQGFDIVTLDGTNYTTFPGGMCLSSSADSTAEKVYELSVDIFDAFQNQSTLINEGVTVNDVLSDEYTLSVENFVEEALDDYTFIDGSIFIARDGGFITRVHANVVVNNFDSFFAIDPNVAGLDPNTETTGEITADYFPVDGFEPFVPPEDCSSD